MIEKEKCIFCWSGGKDSALALYKIVQENKYDIVALLTTINETFNRVSMHGVRVELLEKQAKSIGLPLIKMYVRESTNDEYERMMETLLLEQKSKGVTKIIFGDIFLEDLRVYRENNLAKVGLTAVFPLWKQNTKDLIHEFFDLGFKTIVCCVNDEHLNKEQVGVKLNQSFINKLPTNVDVCGENGEFHTFCYEGPIFNFSIKFKIGEKLYKPIELNTIDSKTKGFWFCDLMLH